MIDNLGKLSIARLEQRSWGRLFYLKPGCYKGWIFSGVSEFNSKLVQIKALTPIGGRGLVGRLEL